MWPYLVMFFVPALVAMTEVRRPVKAHQVIFRWDLPWLVAGLMLTMLVGLRYEVGGDWANYLKNFDEATYRDFFLSLTWDDPGYRLVEWLALQLDWGIAGVNVVCALMFSLGLTVFCQNLPRPWLSLSVAMPYLVIIVGMGYTRQAVAIGCAMIGLVALERQRVRLFLFWVLLAATFHKSAVLLLPIAALAATRHRWWIAFWVLVVTALAYVLMLQESVDALRANYIDAEYESEGAFVRLLMNALAAALFLWYRRKFPMTISERKLWTLFALLSFGLLGAYFVSPSSTAVDRVALYMLPLQPVVFAYLPEALGPPRGKNILPVLGILIYYASVQLVWLNFANNAEYWLPYRSFIVDLPSP